ncbi:MAG: hypothetical protein E6H57_01880 [Betaproteobacteria bacterium]|nr:MAG: hypothetical protein E6H57_01880 [Betaproteobacteria bacterium]
MTRTMLTICLMAALPLAAQDMKPNQEPVPSPSDLRANRGQDRPQGQAPEDRTPSPADIATERPRIDGDRPSDAIQDPRNAAAGGSAGKPLPENNRGEPIRTY